MHEQLAEVFDGLRDLCQRVYDDNVRLTKENAELRRDIAETIVVVHLPPTQTKE